MGQAIAVVSGKGGTGKTSFTANVGMALAQLGRKTLCPDCDVGLRNLDPARPYYMQFTMKADERTFYKVVSEEISKPIDPLELVGPKELPLFDKYDEFLPDELVRKGFAYGVLDLDGLRETILSWDNQ